MQTCRFVKDDRKPDLGATLKYDDGSAVNLAGCAVAFHMRQYLGRAYAPAYKVRAAATVTSAAGGRVKYEWAASDLDTVGQPMAGLISMSSRQFNARPLAQPL